MVKNCDKATLQQTLISLIKKGLVDGTAIKAMAQALFSEENAP